MRGLPYADGRYAHGTLDRYPGPDRVGYLARQPHPNTGADAPVGFALVSGRGGALAHGRVLDRADRAPRRARSRRSRATSSSRHPGPWTIAFQHDNTAAAGFWRRVAGELFGPEGEAWTEEQRPVPGKPEVPPDHWIETAAPRIAA